jgi:SOS-response transcriptional repressor LexA
MISKNQVRVLEVISAWKRDDGIAPSMREVASAVGLSAPGVRKIMITLEHLGHLKRYPGKPRAVAVIRMPEAA